MEKSCEKAVEWYQKAAEQGLAEAQSTLGIQYYAGEGVCQSFEKAVEWFRKGAEQDDPESQILLGLCYAKGTGVRINRLLSFIGSVMKMLSRRRRQSMANI